MMQLTSPAFVNNEWIPAKYTCDGENINPPLQITNPPENTESFALIMDDPDAPRGTWVHWVMWNIPPSTREIVENSVPPGALQGVNSAGSPTYQGPCPPSGSHRYFFKLFALDTKLDLHSNITKEDLLAEVAGHELAFAELVGIYERQL